MINRVRRTKEGREEANIDRIRWTERRKGMSNLEQGIMKEQGTKDGQSVDRRPDRKPHVATLRAFGGKLAEVGEHLLGGAGLVFA